MEEHEEDILKLVEREFGERGMRAIRSQVISEFSRTGFMFGVPAGQFFDLLNWLHERKINHRSMTLVEAVEEYCGRGKANGPT